MSGAERTAENRAVYAELAELLTLAGLAEQALYLNWGYESVAGEADASLLSSDQLGPNAAHERLVLELVADTPLDRQRLLDVGCGRGGALALLARHYRPFQMVGVDLSPEHIAFCQRRHQHPRLRFQVADASRLPQADESLDVVFNLESSGAYPDLASFFRHVARVLRHDGVFLFGDVIDPESAREVAAYLSELGFFLERQRSVRQQVLAARRAVSPALLEQLERVLRDRGQHARIAELELYFATPASPIYRALEAGALDYRLWTWRRRGKWRGQYDPAPLLAARLGSRQARFDQAIGRAGHTAQDHKGWFPGLSPDRTPPDRTQPLHVFALPYAGGTAAIYRSWPDHMPEHIQFCALELPGRGRRIAEPAFTSMEELLDALEAVIAPYAHAPWAVVGVSLGAKVAFELARRFEARGLPPALLFLLACPAPAPPVGRAYATLTTDDLVEELRQLGGTPEDVLSEPELVNVVTPALRFDGMVSESYVPSPNASTEVPMVLIAAEDDHLVPLEAAQSWALRARGRFDFRVVRGGHFFLRAQRKSLCDQLVAALAQTERG